MLKVAHTSLIYFRLSENWIHTQVKHLQDCESVVFTNETANLGTVNWRPAVFSRSHALPVGIREADSLAMWMIGYYPSFYWKAKKENIDLIHAHFGPMGFLSSSLAQKINVPLVTTFYGYDASLLPQKEPKWKLRYQKLFDRGSCFLVEGPAMKQKLVNLGCPTDKIIVHHLGIELEQYPVRQQFSSDIPLRLLMVGRFVEKKGFIFGLKAFQNFLAKGGEGTLSIIGDSSGTPESDQIKKQLLDYVDNHDMHDFVSFAGMIPLDELRKEYYKHDIFIAPSIQATNGDSEGGAPVTTIEASATGMPVIGSLHCDIPEVVKHEESGLLAAEKDSDVLADYLFQLYEKPAMREKMGKAGARLIREEFSAVEQGKGLSRIYRECLK